MAICKDKYKFSTSEASSKAALRTQGVIDEFLNITNLVKFRKLNTLWSNNAKERFGIQERLFAEDNNKAVPNRNAFSIIDKENFKQARIAAWRENKQNNVKVKEGVNFVFEQNPELANVVYEALGYDILNIDLKINRVGNRMNVVTSSSNNKAQIDITVEDKNAYITNTFVEKVQQGFGTLSYIKLANELIKQGLILTSDLNGLDLQESGKALWESLVSKNLAFYNSNIGRYVFSGQQAQQVYSQYLAQGGSKQDIDNFANFVSYENSSYSKIGSIQQFRDYIMSKNFAAVEEFLVVNNKIDRKC